LVQNQEAQPLVQQESEVNNGNYDSDNMGSPCSHCDGEGLYSVKKGSDRNGKLPPFCKEQISRCTGKGQSYVQARNYGGMMVAKAFLKTLFARGSNGDRL
jgi:hypothetical protein